MKNLDAIVPELATYIPKYNQSKTAISEAAVGWHIEHCLLVIKQITSTVAQSEPKLYKSKFNMSRFFVFLSKTIPRGKAKAPKVFAQNKDKVENYLMELWLESKITRSTFKSKNLTVFALKK